MSFHWNLSSSSSEEDNHEEEDNHDVTNNGLGVARLPPPSTSFVTETPEQKAFSSSSSSSDENDEVDWEDAEEVDDDDFGDSEIGFAENDTKLSSTSTTNDAMNSNSPNTENVLKPVTIDMNDISLSKQQEKGHNKKRKSRQTYSFRSLPLHIQNLVQDLHQSHLLTLTGRAIQISKCCSDLQLMHIAHSLVPSQWALSSSVAAATDRDDTSLALPVLQPPTENDVREFCNWFFHWINTVEQRRRQTNRANIAAGAPITERRRRRQQRKATTTTNQQPVKMKNPNKGYGRTTPNSLIDVCSYLSQQYDDNPQLLFNTNDNNNHDKDENDNDRVTTMFVPPTITEMDKVQILVAMARSLGWRARYVVNLTPMKQDLDVEHPLFLINSLENVFETVGNQQQNKLTKDVDDDDDGDDKIFKTQNKRRRTTTKQSPKTAKRDKHRDILNFEKPKSVTSKTFGNVSTSLVDGPLAWVEILCSRNDSSHETKKVGKAKSTDTITTTTTVARPNHPRWIHIDPSNEMWNTPKKVEYLLPSSGSTTTTMPKSMKQKDKRKKSSTRSSKSTISYALAVEHAMVYELLLQTNFEDDGDNEDDDNPSRTNPVITVDKLMNCLVRLTDVTPRYANAWSETLKQRGMTPKEMVSTTTASAASNSNKLKINNTMNDKASWWTDAIRKTNRLWRLRAKKLLNNAQSSTMQTPTAMGQLKNDAKVKANVLVNDLEKTGKEKIMKKSQSAAIVTNKEDEEHGVVVLDDSSLARDNNAVTNTHQHDDTNSAMNEFEEHRGATDDAEQAELADCVSNEAIPTSKTAFKNHPLYAISSVLNSAEVLAPDAKKRVCGLFKGELVYKRSDVSTAQTAKKWLYKGRKVKEKEMKKPIKRINARKKPKPKGFQSLKSYGMGTTNDGSEEAQQRDLELASVPLEEYDGMEDLYGVWQTRPWTPAHVAPNDPIPVNEYKNVELELINPGLVHLEEPKMSVVAKKLCIPYAPCLLGFEGHGGNRTPKIRGIVVHAHNEFLLREAYAEFQSQAAEQEHVNRRRKILKQWNKLIVGMLIKERIDREYGDQE